MNSPAHILRQILESSDRVAKAREMFGLGDAEYLITLRHDEAVIGNTNNQKIRKVNEIGGQKPYEFYREVIIPYVQNEIIDFFGIPIHGIGHILKKRTPVKNYGTLIDGGEKSITYDGTNVQLELRVPKSVKDELESKNKLKTMYGATYQSIHLLRKCFTDVVARS